MKVAVLDSGRIVLRDGPPPEPVPGSVVVALAACGVCGTDVEKLRGNYRTAGILGHEAVGSVVAVGDGVDGRAVGDRVFVHHHVPCYTCTVCRRGDLTLCPDYSKTNLDPGGFAERFRASPEHVSKGAVLGLAPNVSWEVGALLEPAACALTAIRLLGGCAGRSVFLVGLGPVGLLYARVARALGANWVGGAELSEKRRTAAERGGIDTALDPSAPEEVHRAVRANTGGVGVDLAVVATGSPKALDLAAELPRRGGTLNLFGLPDVGSHLGLDLQRLYLQGYRVVPTYATTERDLAELHALVAGGRLSLDGLVSHRLPLTETAEAFRLAGAPHEALKVVVTGPAFS
ncbi:MAG TPA: alcohol dehydrogenase catalytic domain-containing protein [Thermoplasmata archaeon]|nr:alcohol dehydrogenase catalytic domain-containing protein [Thermoplasmata archaeon]